MGDPATYATSNVQAQDATSATLVSGAHNTVKAATDLVLGAVDKYGYPIAQKGKAMIDSTLPPEQRTAFFAKLESFMLANPKLSAFLGINLLLSGIPLGAFILFSLSVFIFALVVTLATAILAAVAFTLFAVGSALLVVVPVVLFTTGTATFLFLWGLVGYYILKWANRDTQSGSPDRATDVISTNEASKSYSNGQLAGSRGIETSGYNDRFTVLEEPHKNANTDQKASTDIKTGLNAQPGLQ